MKPDNTRNQKGKWAERAAALYLQLKGYKILRRNWATPVGEIDILARRGQNLVLVEVKYRTTITAALVAISPQQAARQQRALRYAMAAYARLPNAVWRHDLIALAPWRWPTHVRAILQES